MEILGESKEYCKLCLVTDVKLFSLSTPSLSEAYLQLLQIPSLSAQGYSCYECTCLLGKYKQFYTKCSNAHVLLTYINPDHSQITKQMVQFIDRKFNNLESNLVRTEILIDHLDLVCESDLEIKSVDQIKIEENQNNVANHFLETTTTHLDVSLTNKKNLRSKRNTIRKKEIPEVQLRSADVDEIFIKDENDPSDNNSNVDFPDDVYESDDEIPVSELSKRKKSKEVKLESSNKSTYKKGTKKRETLTEKSIVKNRKKSTAKKDTKEKINKKKVSPQHDIFKDYATVITLSKEEAVQEMLLRKESKNYKTCTFKCELCYKAFEIEMTFENHMKRHTEEYGNFECEICHLRFSSYKLKYSHYQSTHTRKFICKMCPYTCINSHQASNHINIHKGKKFKCDVCGEEFSFSNTLLFHKKTKHQAEEVCDICGSVFVNDAGVRKHKQLKHQQQKNEGNGPSCDECNVQFSTETAWKRHLVLSPKHKHIISNGCEHCGETFAERRALKKHIKTHNASRRSQAYRKPPSTRIMPILPAPCSICGVWLTTPGMYKAHMAASHPDAARPDPRPAAEWICDVCGKALKARHHLDSHLLIHKGERPFQCDKCNRAFRTKGALSVHLEKHGYSVIKKRDSTVPRECHLCGKVFEKVGALTKHIKNVHMKYRPYKCPYCEKAFPTPYEVKVHTQHVHNKEPWPKRARAKPRAPLHQ